MMRSVRPVYAIFLTLLCFLFLLTGCSQIFYRLPASEASVPSPTFPSETVQDTSLAMLRQTMAGTAELFAVAYLGQLDEAADISAYIRENNPQLLQSYPFIGNISQEQILGTTGEIYCIIPRDKDASILAIRSKWLDGSNTVHADTIYQAHSGSPFILLCNSENILDTYISVTTPKGDTVTWWPGIDDSFTISLPYDDGIYQARDISLYEAGPRDIYHSWYQDGWTMPYGDTLDGTQWIATGTGADGREVRMFLVLNANGTANLSWQYTDGPTQEYFYGTWSAWLEHRAFLELDLQRTGGVLSGEKAAFSDAFAVLLSPEGDRLLLGFSFHDSEFPMEPVSKDVQIIFDRSGR